MQRRTLLRVGAVTAAALAVAGAGVALWQPGWHQGKLTTQGREVFAAVSRAVLEGLLAETPNERELQVAEQLTRLEAAIGAFPRSVQDELAQLLAVLCSAPGRMGLFGLGAAWAEADPAEVQKALQALRVSTLPLRQQTYLALRDLSYGAFFADPSAWKLAGYPGPLPIAASPSP
jgi:hypothetical protein